MTARGEEQHAHVYTARFDTGLDSDVLCHVGQARSATWDALASPDNFYNTHAWLRALELAQGHQPVVAATMGGRLVGALPTWPGQDSDSDLFCLPTMLPRLQVRRPANYLWLGARRAVYNELLCVRGTPRRAVLRVLLEGALELAADRGADGVVMPYLAADDARELAAVHPRARHLLHSADANLAVPVGGAAELFAHSGQRDRSRRRAELRAFERTGATVTFSPLTQDIEQDCARLIALNRARYGADGGLALMERSFAAQRATGILERAVACLALRDGRITAVTIGYAHADRLYARYFGCDYTAAAPACEYFVLVYHAMVDYAAQSGFRRYRLAVSAWEVKIRRGATLAPLAAVVLPINGTVCSREQADAANAAAVRAWRAMCRTRPRAMGPDWDAWNRPTAMSAGGERNRSCCTSSTASN